MVSEVLVCQYWKLNYVALFSANFVCFNLVLNSGMGRLGTKCCSVIAYGGSSGSVSQLPGTRWLSILRCKSTSISSSSVKVRWNKKYHQRWRQHRPINCLDFLDCCHCCHCCHCLHCSHCFQFLHCIDYLDCLHWWHCFHCFHCLNTAYTVPRQACLPLIQLFVGFASESYLFNQRQIYKDRETAIGCL